MIGSMNIWIRHTCTCRYGTYACTLYMYMYMYMCMYINTHAIMSIDMNIDASLKIHRNMSIKGYGSGGMDRKRGG